MRILQEKELLVLWEMADSTTGKKTKYQMDLQKVKKGAKMWKGLKDGGNSLKGLPLGKYATIWASR